MLLRELGGVADVVAVTVGDRDDVDALGLLLAVGALRIARQERVDVDALAAGAVEAKGGVPEPGEFCVCYAAEGIRATEGGLRPVLQSSR
jgi:hypothetical protein